MGREMELRGVGEGEGSVGVPRAERGSETRPDPEVVARARRRRFTTEYKLRILREAEARTDTGQLGALLRREGLYSSHLAKWRQQRTAGLTPRKRGRKPKRDPVVRRVAELERENAKLREELRKAELIIDVQKKVAQLVGETPDGGVK